SNALVYNWTHSYQLFGNDGLKNRRSPKKYTSEFKRDVLHFIETTGASFGEAARKFKLPTGSMISRWQRSSLSSKEQGLPIRKGRSKREMIKPTKKQKKSKKLSREKELEREVELLRIENEYLKKLQTFQQTIMAKRNGESKSE
ncbi:hypothetical protein, partial [Enterococcus termitis]